MAEYSKGLQLKNYILIIDIFMVVAAVIALGFVINETNKWKHYKEFNNEIK